MKARVPNLFFAIVLLSQLAVGLLAGSHVFAQDRSASKLLPQRLVHRFDFEDTDDRGQKIGFGHTWPRHWYVVGRSPHTADPNFLRQPLHQQLVDTRGYPTFTDVRFDHKHATSGDFSFYLGLDGGNAAAFLEVGAVPAVPGSDYLLTARVRTEQLVHARGRFTAYFVDRRGMRIDASIRHSQPIRTQGQWTTIAVPLVGDYPHAAWIGIEVAVLQPTLDKHNPLGKQQIVLTDVQGQAWFDDISIWQVPHADVRSQSPVNIVRQPDQPRVVAKVRDYTGRQLLADIRVYDETMTQVDGKVFRVGLGAPMRWNWTPTLPGLGWYLVDMTVSDVGAGGMVARSRASMLWLGKQAGDVHGDLNRFTLVAEDLPNDQLGLLPDLLDAAGLRRVVVSAWARDTTLDNLDARLELLDNLLGGVLGSGRSVAMSLWPLPAELAGREQVATEDPLEMLQGPQSQWLPYLAPVLMRESQRVRHWQLGTAKEAQSFFMPSLASRTTEIEQQFRELAPRPQLLLPWKIEHSRHTDVSSNLAYAMDVSPGVTPETLDEHVTPWSDAISNVWLYLREPGADQLAQPARVTDLAQRMVEGWRSQPAGLGLVRPWTPGAGRDTTLLPDPLLGVFTNVAHLLAGRQVLAQLPLGDGLKCYVLDGPAGGMLACWNVKAEPEDATLQMYLGADQPVVVDVWGNRSPMELEAGKHTITFTQTPTFITGIDPKLALFRASFHVTPELLESTQQPHQRTLRVTNPWPRTISGHFLMLEPEGWRIAPSRHYFSISAGGTLELPIEMQFPVAEVAGPKRLIARFDFTADQRHVVDMATPLEVGLSQVDFNATIAVEQGSEQGTQDAVLACVITNTSDETMALYVFANLAGHPRQERIIAQLEPGQSVVRRFRFRNVGDKLLTTPVRTGVREANGPAMLNQLISPW